MHTHKNITQKNTDIDKTNINTQGHIHRYTLRKTNKTQKPQNAQTGMGMYI